MTDPVKIDNDEARPWLLPEMGQRVVNGKVVESHSARMREARLPTAAELQFIRKAAREEGYTEGLAAGTAKGRELADTELRGKRKQLQMLLDDLARPLAAIDDEAEQLLVQMAMAVARQVIRREISQEPAHVVAIVREAITLLPHARQAIRVYLHPEDATLVRDIFALDTGAERNWQVLDDPSQNRGGCRIATDDTQIDATIDTRVARAVAHVLGEAREGEL